MTKSARHAQRPKKMESGKPNGDGEDGGNGGNGGDDEQAQVIFDLTRGSALWFGLMTKAVKDGYDAFDNSFKASAGQDLSSVIDVSFDNSIVQASVAGWVKAVNSAFNAVPKELLDILGNFLQDNP
jgi:hypothetical protein